MKSGLLRVGVIVVSGMVVAAMIAVCVRDDSTATPMFVPTVDLATKVSEPTADEISTATATAAVEVAATLALAATPVLDTPTPILSLIVKPTYVPVPTATATIVSEPTASISTPDPTATVEPTVTPTSSPTATATAMPDPSPTEMPSPTLDPLDEIRFVDNEDCFDGIDRDLLPTIDLVIEHGDASHLVVTEVADEARERQQGLMCRETVPNGSGMLFVFETARVLNFWMFNTYAPLDIVYLDDDRRVVRAVRMEPCPRPEDVEHGAWSSACSAASNPYGSGGAARYALELPAGWLASVGLDLGNLEGAVFRW